MLALICHPCYFEIHFENESYLDIVSNYVGSPILNHELHEKGFLSTKRYYVYHCQIEYLLQIPKRKLEFARYGSFSMGLKLFNSCNLENVDVSAKRHKFAC